MTPLLGSLPSMPSHEAGRTSWLGGVASPSRHATRRLAKHQFRKESDLVRALSARFEDLFDALEAFPGHAVEPHLLREWQVGRRLADMLAFGMKPGWAAATTNYLRPLARLTLADSMVLAHLVRCPMGLRDLKQMVFMQEGELEALLVSLMRNQLIIEGSDGVLSPASDWVQWVPHSLHLVEAKIEDWREALSQADYYRSFADAVSIALPMSFSGRVDVADACRAAGVGLILVPVDGPPRTEVKAQQIPDQTATRKLQCSMQVIKRLMLNSTHANSI